MKKTLAIVLALVMVLAMIPAMSAEVTYNVTKNDGQYNLSINSYGDDAAYAEVAGANTITLKYDWNDVKGDVVSKWADKKAIALVRVVGFGTDAQEFTDAATFTIDGKVLKAAEGCEYANDIGFDAAAKALTFPVELTKAGYTDTFLITVTETNEQGKVMTENAKISIVLKNIGVDGKGTKTAVVTNIASKTDEMSAYIVGDKIYFDFINDTKEAQALITFADENGKAMPAYTYAKNPLVKNAAGNYVENTAVASTIGSGDVLLDASAAKFAFAKDSAATLKFYMETEAAYYLTKAYTLKFRADIKPEDPKGIYFAENTKTIAMGEKFAPVVVGVKTGKPVAAEIYLGSKTDAEVIDVLDKTTVIGTREGVAYVTATYTVPGSTNTYVANAMKVVVTLPGESIPAVDPAAEIYYVTCRNLNVRAGAGTSYKKVDMIHRGDAVKVLEIKNGWAKVADGTYVCAKYIAK